LLKPIPMFQSLRSLFVSRHGEAMPFSKSLIPMPDRVYIHLRIPRNWLRSCRWIIITINSLFNLLLGMLHGLRLEGRVCSIISAIFQIRRDGLMSVICVSWWLPMTNLVRLEDSALLRYTQEKLGNPWSGTLRAAQRAVGICLERIFLSNYQMDLSPQTQT